MCYGNVDLLCRCGVVSLKASFYRAGLRGGYTGLRRWQAKDDFRSPGSLPDRGTSIVRCCGESVAVAHGELAFVERLNSSPFELSYEFFCCRAGNAIGKSCKGRNNNSLTLSLKD